jgi:amidophosphoribosyltransferase
MCGLAGVLIGKRSRAQCNIASATALFTRLLILSEHRGPYATGAAVVTEDGTIRTVKAPVSAHRFVHSVVYARLCQQADKGVALLMGHTRWPTQGSHLHNENNQPLLSDGPVRLAITHNGDIPNATWYFDAFGLQRKWEVDSELLLRLACRHLSQDGLAVADMIHDLAFCAGHMAAVMAVVSRPDEVLFLRRDRPIWIAYHDGLDLLAYASESTILLQALSDCQAWKLQHMPAETVWVVNRQYLMNPKAYSLRFAQGGDG